jgi:hypothetical protein
LLVGATKLRLDFASPKLNRSLYSAFMMNTALSLAVLAAVVTSASIASADEPVSSTTTTQASASGSASFSASSSGAGGTASVPGADGDFQKDVLPWIVGGLGAASIITGVVLHVASPDMPSNCIESTRTCTRKPNQSDASFSEDQDQAGQAQLLPNLGNIAIAGGAVLLVAGVSMYFWYHQDTSKMASKKPILTPYAGPNGGGVAGFLQF